MGFKWNLKSTLSQAFERLEQHERIIARKHHACCSSCGTKIMNDLSNEHPDAYDGYVFFNHQDTTSAVDSGSIYLSFGTFHAYEDDDDDLCAEYTKEVGERIFNILREEGVSCEWNGNSRSKIQAFLDKDAIAEIKELLDDELLELDSLRRK
jgi:hypothetical protein